MTVLYCIDCKHLRVEECWRPIPSLVFRTVPLRESAANQRTSTQGYCGLKAVFFESASTPQPQPQPNPET